MADSMDDLTGNMTATVSAYAAQTQNSAMLGNESTTYNGGNITLNIYGAEGQNVNDLAEIIADKLEDMTRRKEAVYV